MTWLAELRSEVYFSIRSSFLPARDVKLRLFVPDLGRFNRLDVNFFG